jgi:uncharacterized protein YecE (DUF72 family)
MAPDALDLFGDQEGGPASRAIAPTIRSANGATVVLGTSGFSFADWVGPFYPPGTSRSDMLAFYAGTFSAVEVNATYYRIPTPRTMEQLDRKTPAGFEFVVKAHQSMTHARERPSDALFDEFEASLLPLRRAGKFRGVLLQFPWSFQAGAESEKRIDLLRERLGRETPLFAEFRHVSWIEERVFQFLEERRIGYCSVDEPAIPGLVPPIARLTGDVGYVRFHGRNRGNWWGGDASLRYDYLYTAEELREWVARIRELAARASKVYVFFNNCHAGQAARNALLMHDLIQRELLP